MGLRKSLVLISPFISRFMNRKAVFTIILIASLLALGAGVYFAWRKSQEILNPPAPYTGSGLPAPVYRDTSTPGAAAGPEGDLPSSQIAALSDQPVLGYWVLDRASTRTATTTAAMDRIFYVNNKGHVYEVKAGNDEMHSTQDIPDIASVKASPNGRFALAASRSASNFSLRLFNVEAKTWRELINGRFGAFSSDGARLAYLRGRSAGAGAELVVRDMRTSRQTESVLSAIPEYDGELFWAGSKILLAPRPSALYDAEAWVYDTARNTFSLFTRGSGLAFAWSEDGKTGLRFRVINNAPELSLVDGGGVVLASVGITTLPSKCAFMTGLLYCAVPLAYNSLREPLLPDDYLKRAAYSTDAIYRLSTTDNTLEPLPLPFGVSVDVAHPRIHGNRLLFVNRYDDRLYGLNVQPAPNN